MREPSRTLTHEKRENSPRVPQVVDGRVVPLSCDPVEAAGLAEREPFYVLARELAFDRTWIRTVVAICAGDLDEKEVARRYGRNRSDARDLFAELLDACRLDLSPRDTRDPRVSMYLAMANLPGVMSWDASKREPGARRYWPDRRSYAKWARGAEVLAARGAPSCASCGLSPLAHHKSRRERANEAGPQADGIGASERRPRRIYCDVCLPKADVGHDDRCARSLLDAVCAVTAGESREYERREHWRRRGSRRLP